MKKLDYQKVEKVIGYVFNNKTLLKQAFVRSSYANENGCESNEVLEFVGDKVLDLAVIRVLLERFGKQDATGYFKSKKQEGDLTKIKSELVSTGYLAGSFDALNLDEFICWGKSDLNNKTENVLSIKEDVFESIIGAIALDSNWDMERIIKIVKKLLHLNDFFNKSSVDSNTVGRLQETCVAFMLGEPKYKLDQIQKGNGLVWRATVTVKGIKGTETGVGQKQKDAKREAALKMMGLVRVYGQKNITLETIKKKTDVFATINSYVQAGEISKPYYDFSEEYDQNGNPAWECRAYIDTLGYYYIGHGSSKKAAQMKALSVALKDIE